MATALNEQEIELFLNKNTIGRIGCTDGEEVYVVPVNYKYEDNAVLCYSLEGHKIDLMRKHPAVCFEVEDIKSPDNWKCIVIHGKFEEITDKKELDELRPHYTEYILRERAGVAAPQAGAALHAQVLYRIRFIKVSGRFEQGFAS